MWERCVPMIDEALKHSEGELLKEDILPHLMEGNMRLWIGVEDGEVIGCMVTEIVKYPRKRIVRVITIAANKSMDSWYHFMPMLEGYAVNNNCFALEAWTRKGMARKLKDWKCSYQVITKEIEHRVH